MDYRTKIELIDLDLGLGVSTGACAIALALSRAYPHLRRIKVDLGKITVSDTKERVRKTYETTEYDKFIKEFDRAAEAGNGTSHITRPIVRLTGKKLTEIKPMGDVKPKSLRTVAESQSEWSATKSGDGTVTSTGSRKQTVSAKQPRAKSRRELALRDGK